MYSTTRPLAIPYNTHRIPLGYSDQVFNQSKDHLQDLKDYKNMVENTIQRADQPYTQPNTMTK